MTRREARDRLRIEFSYVAWNVAANDASSSAIDVCLVDASALTLCGTDTVVAIVVVAAAVDIDAITIVGDKGTVVLVVLTVVDDVDGGATVVGIATQLAVVFKLVAFITQLGSGQ